LRRVTHGPFFHRVEERGVGAGDLPRPRGVRRDLRGLERGHQRPGRPTGIDRDLAALPLPLKLTEPLRDAAGALERVDDMKVNETVRPSAREPDVGPLPIFGDLYCERDGRRSLLFHVLELGPDLLVDVGFLVVFVPDSEALPNEGLFGEVLDHAEHRRFRRATRDEARVRLTPLLP